MVGLSDCEKEVLSSVILTCIAIGCSNLYLHPVGRGWIVSEMPSPMYLRQFGCKVSAENANQTRQTFVHENDIRLKFRYEGIPL